RFLFGRTSFALEEAARDLAGGERLFLIIDGEREEILAFFRLVGADDGAEHGCAAEGRQHGTVSLARDAAGLEDELLAGPTHFFAVNFKHVFLFRLGPLAPVESHQPQWLTAFMLLFAS